MSQSRLSCLPFLATAAIIAATSSQPAPAASLPIHSANSSQQADEQARDSYGKLPISFEANRGQTDPEVRYLSRTAGFSLFLTPTEAVLSLKAPTKHGNRAQGLGSLAGDQADFDAANSAVVRLSLEGGNRKPAMQALDKQASTTLTDRITTCGVN